MKSAKTLILLGGAALILAPLSARADHAWFHGRTGLPTVREAQEKIWMERGLVHLKVIGNSLEVTQDLLSKRAPEPRESSSGKIPTKGNTMGARQ
jgi:hypothetical protein